MPSYREWNQNPIQAVGCGLAIVTRVVMERWGLVGRTVSLTNCLSDPFQPVYVWITAVASYPASTRSILSLLRFERIYAVPLIADRQIRPTGMGPTNNS